MLTFITGLPGSGKSLYCVEAIDKLSRDQGRPVYYNSKKDPDDPNSPGQFIILDKEKLPWIPFDDYSGFDWHNAPEGAIILLDEAHRELFPMRKVGDPVPTHVDAMSTHRHRAHDVFLTAQHSTQVDTFIRKMAGEHHHFKRNFGSQRSTHFIWMEHSNERDKWARKEADSSTFKFPRSYFGSYKSTVLDTVETKLPWKRISILVAGALSIPVLLLFGINAIRGDDAEPYRDSGEYSEATMHVIEADPSIRDRPILYTSATWKREVEDIPFSANLYDAIIKIESYPKIAGCSRITEIGGEDKCDCYSQQGSNLRISYRACVDYMKNGWFDFSRSDQSLEKSASSKTSNTSTPMLPQPASPPSGAVGAAGSP